MNVKACRNGTKVQYQYIYIWLGTGWMGRNRAELRCVVVGRAAPATCFRLKRKFKNCRFLGVIFFSIMTRPCRDFFTYTRD